MILITPELDCYHLEVKFGTRNLTYSFPDFCSGQQSQAGYLN